MSGIAGGSVKFSSGVSGLVKKTPRLYCSSSGHFCFHKIKLFWTDFAVCYLILRLHMVYVNCLQHMNILSEI